MAFEWDEDKSRKTAALRGISFKEAQKIWEDPESLQVAARTEGEMRWAQIGKVDDKIYTAILTRRDNKTRIISVRRARSNEITYYEKSEKEIEQ